MTVVDKGGEQKDNIGELTSTAKNKLIQECVEKVLKKLESKLER